MSKPNWDDAPKWAKWLAQDSDEDWYWYQNKPTYSEGKWRPNGGRADYAGYSEIELQPEPRP